MRTLDPTCDLVRGAMTAERSAEGLRLSRLPASAAGRDPDPQLVLSAEMAAGIRLCFDSSTRWLEIELEATGLRYAGGIRRPVMFDLYVDGHLFERRALAEGPTFVVDFAQSPAPITREPGPVVAICFGPLPAGEKRVELWLPQNAAILLKAVRIDAGAVVIPFPCEPAWLHYGSSISHGKEADGPSEAWPAAVARHLALDLTSLGYSGNCLLEGFVAQAMVQRRAALLSLEIGINIVTSDAMRERAFVPAVHGFLDILRSDRPHTPILVISPVHAGVFENRPGPARRGKKGIIAVPRPAELSHGALTAATVRRLIEGIVARRRAQGDANLHYCDGRLLFGAEDAHLLADGLHPCAEGQRLIGQRAVPIFRQFVADG